MDSSGLHDKSQEIIGNTFEFQSEIDTLLNNFHNISLDAILSSGSSTSHSPNANSHLVQTMRTIQSLAGSVLSTIHSGPSTSTQNILNAKKLELALTRATSLLAEVPGDNEKTLENYKKGIKLLAVIFTAMNNTSGHKITLGTIDSFLNTLDLPEANKFLFKQAFVLFACHHPTKPLVNYPIHALHDLLQVLQTNPKLCMQFKNLLEAFILTHNKPLKFCVENITDFQIPASLFTTLFNPELVQDVRYCQLLSSICTMPSGELPGCIPCILIPDDLSQITGNNIWNLPCSTKNIKYILDCLAEINTEDPNSLSKLCTTAQSLNIPLPNALHFSLFCSGIFGKETIASIPFSTIQGVINYLTNNPDQLQAFLTTLSKVYENDKITIIFPEDRDSVFPNNTLTIPLDNIIKFFMNNPPKNTLCGEISTLNAITFNDNGQIAKKRIHAFSSMMLAQTSAFLKNLLLPEWSSQLDTDKIIQTSQEMFLTILYDLFIREDFSELLPNGIFDVKTLIPILMRFQTAHKFGIEELTSKYTTFIIYCISNEILTLDTLQDAYIQLEQSGVLLPSLFENITEEQLQVFSRYIIGKISDLISDSEALTNFLNTLGTILEISNLDLNTNMGTGITSETLQPFLNVSGLSSTIKSLRFFSCPFSYNQLVDLSQFFSNAENISIINCFIQENAISLANLQNIWTITLAGCSAITTLQGIHLPNSHLKCIKLVNCPDLVLDVKDLTTITSLKQLFLANKVKFGNTFFSDLATLTQLQELRLEGCLNDSSAFLLTDIKPCQNLLKLLLQGMTLSSENLIHLLSIAEKSLMCLEVIQCENFDRACLEFLENNFKNISMLNLSYCSSALSPLIIPFIKNNPNLSEIYLNGSLGEAVFGSKEAFYTLAQHLKENRRTLTVHITPTDWLDSKDIEELEQLGLTVIIDPSQFRRRIGQNIEENRGFTWRRELQNE